MITVKKIQIPKSNYEEGRTHFRPEIIVCHITDGSDGSAEAEFQNPNLENPLSTHYLVKKNGDILQFVDEKDTAFGNGRDDRPTAKLVREKKGVNPNLYSISIEHEAKNQDANEVQYNCSAELIENISSRWLIPLDRDHVIAHYEIRKSKICPLPISVDKLLSLAQDIAKKKLKISILERLVGLYQLLLSLLKK